VAHVVRALWLVAMLIVLFTSPFHRRPSLHAPSQQLTPSPHSFNKQATTMASPLSPLSDGLLNAKSPAPMNLTPSKSPLAQTTLPTHVPSNADESEINWDEGPSSPFLSHVVDGPEHAIMPSVTPSLVLSESRPESEESSELQKHDETLSARHIESKNGTPFKILEDETSTFHSVRSFASRSAAVSPSKSFSRSSSTHSVTEQVRKEEIKITSHFRQESQTTSQAIGQPSQATFEDSGLLDATFMTVNEEADVDDTCFSTFSQVPNTDMTTFARLGQQSPVRQLTFDQVGTPMRRPIPNTNRTQETPRPKSRHTPGTSRSRLSQFPDRSPSPTPRRNMASLPQYQDCSDTTNLLLDFTQQFDAVALSKQQQLDQQQQRSPTRRSPTKTGTNLLSHLHNQRSPLKPSHQNTLSTPASKKTILNLLDFELPPAPTPRSVPSITIRELESLKSKYSSEISSLRATLSGREAEVESLKRAVSDAERRVGEAVEQTREERSKREYVEKEKEDWQRRGRDFEDVLRKVKEEVISAEKERGDMTSRVEEAEDRARDAESRAAEAEARALEAATKIASTDASLFSPPDGQTGPLFTAEQCQKQIDDKVHALSAELHTIYKKKHLTKVAGLKKGLEAKSREKTVELQAKIEDLERRNDELQGKMDATLSGVVHLPTGAFDSIQREEELKKLEEQNVLIERQKAELAGREEEIRTAKAEFATVLHDLERERIEKGELVAAVDEMLALQADITTIAGSAAGNAVEDFKKSIGIGASKPSGLARPGFGIPQPQSRIGAPSGLSRSTSGGKSRMMSNIERMGNGRAMD
jgi:hypothetical protein